MRYVVTKWLFLFGFTALLAQTAFGQTYSAHLNIYVLNGSNWTDLDIQNEIEKASTIWSQCDLKFNNIQVEKLDLSTRYLNLSDKESQTMVQQIPQLKRPAIFLVHKIDGTGDVGYSYRELRDFGNLDFMKGTIWLPDQILTQEYQARRDPHYSTLAHELAHVLLNLGHTSLRNILGNSPELVNDQITKNQCRRLKLSSYVEKN